MSHSVNQMLKASAPSSTTDQTSQSSFWAAFRALPVIHITRAARTLTAQKKKVPAMNRTEEGYTNGLIDNR